MFTTKIGLTAAAALVAGSLVSVSAEAGSTRDAVHSGAIGALGGAVVGAVVPGVSVGQGALIGGAGGALIGATKKNHHRDRYGRRYYTDRHGYRHYR